MRKPLSHHPDATTRAKINLVPWLRGANASTVTWEDPQSVLTIANTSITDNVAVGYITGGFLDEEYDVKVTITSDDTVARVKVVYIEVRVVKEYL